MQSVGQVLGTGLASETAAWSNSTASDASSSGRRISKGG